MRKMKIGDSIKIKDRTLWTIKNTWLWRASRKLGLENAFTIKAIDKKNHRVWRIK